ncbi:DUF2147 domain-containing protein [uncultured Roseibium sp.]|uniref:DUF2147 domain-containing protein n=1 Tax=uncultured Roseibium sp. TaxID=1936171 RepID=UPI003217FF04
MTTCFKSEKATHLLRAAIVMSLLIGATPASAGLDAFAGDWITPAGATVRIGSCGETPCGRIVNFVPPPGFSVENTRDLKNQDTSKRTRKLLGLAVLYELREAGRNLQGRVYDPRRGFSADATVTASSRDRLTIKGCVRVIFKMCEKETWRRAR